MEQKEFLKNIEDRVLAKDIEKTITRINGVIGNIIKTNRIKPFINIEAAKEMLIIGDSHGDYNSVVSVLNDTKAIELLEKNESFKIIFLGDYIDRADSAKAQFGLLELLLMLVECYPTQVILIKGDHEAYGPDVVSPYTFVWHALEWYGNKGMQVEMAFWKLFAILPYVALCTINDKKHFFVHGGLPHNERVNLSGLNEFIVSPQELPWFAFLWADFEHTNRKEGTFYTKEDVEIFMLENNVSSMFTAHLPVLLNGVCELMSGLWRVHTATNSTYVNRNGDKGFIIISGDDILPLGKHK